MYRSVRVVPILRKASLETPDQYLIPFKNLMPFSVNQLSLFLNHNKLQDSNQFGFQPTDIPLMIVGQTLHASGSDMHRDSY